MKKTLKKIGAVLMALCMVLSLLPVSTLATEDAPQLVDGYYEIYTADQLYWFAEQVNSGNNAINGKLMADIVVNENVLNADGTLNGDGSNFRVWTSIGNDSYAYAGNFDGNGKKVSGLYLSGIKARGVGLIGFAKEATIQNVGVVDSFFQGASQIGGIVGNTYCGTVRDCFNASSINCTYNYPASGGAAGGVVGDNNSGIIENCFNIGVVSGDSGSMGGVGGVVGSDYAGKIKNCYVLLGSAPKAGGGMIMSKEGFATGEVAYLLQGSSSETIWGQAIGVDAIPQFGAEKIYRVCDGTRLSYTNDANAESTHTLEEGSCFACGIYAPSELNGDVYEIYNAGQLYWFAEQVNSGNIAINGKLMNNIAVNENVLDDDCTLNGDGSNFRVWTPIGNSDNSYIGTFDGNGKTVSGLYFNDAEKKYVGLFGYLEHDGTITQVGVEDNYFNAGSYVGGIVGYSCGSISYCYNAGSINGHSIVGGIGGEVTALPNPGMSVYHCYNTGNISARNYIGGVVGLLNFGDKMKSCYNAGVITGTGSEVEYEYEWYVGGVVGLCKYEAPENCYYLQSDGVAEWYGTAVTADQFASGEVCWLLSGGPTSVISKKNDADSPWGQKIGKEKFPGFSEDEVFCITDEQGNVLGYSNVEGELPVLGVTVSGSVTSYLEGDVTVELIQNGEVVHSATVSGGEYAIEGVVNGDYTLRVTKENHVTREYEITVGADGLNLDIKLCPIGDVTGDGNVNIKDFQRLLRHVNKTNPLEGYALACGDVTGDGVCNIKDFQRLLRHVNKTNPLF